MTFAASRYLFQKANQPSHAAVSMAGHEAGAKLSGTGSLARSQHFQTAVTQEDDLGMVSMTGTPKTMSIHAILQKPVGSRQQDMLSWFCSAVDCALGIGAHAGGSAQLAIDVAAPV